MKPNLAFLAILFLGSVPAFADTRPPQTAAKPAEKFDNPLLEDVVQMTRAQLPESSILAFVRARRSRLDVDVTAADLIRLHRAGVSDHVIAYIARITGIEDRSSRDDRDRSRYRDRDRDRDGDRDRDRDRDRDIDRDRDGKDGDADGVIAYDGPRDRDDDGEIEAYGRPWRSVYDSWPGWWDYPYWWGVSPWWGSEIIFRGGGRFHGGRGRDHGWRNDGDRGRWSGGSSHDGASRGWGGSRGGGSRGGGSHGGSHSGGSHGGGGHHGGSGRH